MALIRRTENTQSLAPNRAWDPFQMMDELMRWDPFADFGMRTSLWNGAAFAPSFDVRETHEDYLITADLPGLSADDVELAVSGSTLTISGRREEEQREQGDRVHVVERRYGEFARSFTLPESADADKIEAQLKHGVLKVTLPKKAEHKPRRFSLRNLLRSDNARAKGDEQPNAS